jgi:hypothetical protein
MLIVGLLCYVIAGCFFARYIVEVLASIGFDPDQPGFLWAFVGLVLTWPIFVAAVLAIGFVSWLSGLSERG